MRRSRGRRRKPHPRRDDPATCRRDRTRSAGPHRLEHRHSLAFHAPARHRARAAFAPRSVRRIRQSHRRLRFHGGRYGVDAAGTARSADGTRTARNLHLHCGTRYRASRWPRFAPTCGLFFIRRRSVRLFRFGASLAPGGRMGFAGPRAFSHPCENATAFARPLAILASAVPQSPREPHAPARRRRGVCGPQASRRPSTQTFWTS